MTDPQTETPPATPWDATSWDEGDRLSALHHYGILDTPPEAAFDDLARLAADICGTPIALVSLVDRDRQWFKAEIGLAIRQTPRDISFCAHAIGEDDLFVVPDALADARFRHNPLVSGHPHIRFYAGAILRTEAGLPLGTVCVLDWVPRAAGLTQRQRSALEVIARQVMAQLELRRTLAAHQKSEAQRRALIESMPQIVWSTRADGFHDFYNSRWYEFTGLPEGLTDGEHRQRIIHPDDRARSREAWRHSLKTGLPYEIEYRLRHRSGRYRWTLGRALPVRDRHGGIERWFGTCTDIDEQVAAREILSQGHVELEQKTLVLARDRDRIWRNSHDLLAVATRDGRLKNVNPAWTSTLGIEKPNLIDTRIQDLAHPDDLARIDAEFDGTGPPSAAGTLEFRLRHADGHYCWISWTAATEDGIVYASGRDITEQKAADERLRQAQKMETIGQLTGGVAHDFNNLLTVILGNIEAVKRYSDVLDDAGGQGARIRHAAANALRGAERATALTQRLLAFSRRQPLAPRAVDANRLVVGMAELLAQTLGEHVVIDTKLGDGLWYAHADPNQLENALLNLAVNARDAMPAGGRLIIETANALLDDRDAAANPNSTPGAYVVITVGDTGIGMTDAVVARAFDPFFTTKDIGHGTGLGLSQVYGFVKQSGGHVKIHSQPGVGTLVRVFLPRLTAPGLDPPQTIAVEAPLPGNPTETILVVEDDDDVRRHSTAVLRELGYRVLEASRGAEALAMLARHSDVAMLFTDIGLPGGMNGRALAEQAQRLRPGLPVLFATGYAQGAVTHGGQLDAGLHVIFKPFTFQALAAKARAVLDDADAPLSILVVEDEALVRMVVTETLTEAGFHIEEATTAAGARARLCAAGARFDAAILDIGLPDSRGDLLAVELRETWPDLPIVIASGYDQHELAAQFADDPRIAIVSKPYDSRRLQQALETLGVVPPRRQDDVV